MGNDMEHGVYRGFLTHPVTGTPKWEFLAVSESPALSRTLTLQTEISTKQPTCVPTTMPPWMWRHWLMLIKTTGFHATILKTTAACAAVSAAADATHSCSADVHGCNLCSDGEYILLLFSLCPAPYCICNYYCYCTGLDVSHLCQCFGPPRFVGGSSS